MANDHGCCAGSLSAGAAARRSKLASIWTPGCFESGKLHTRRSGLRLVGAVRRIASMIPSTASTATLSLSPVSRAPSSHCCAAPNAQTDCAESADAVDCADCAGICTCRSFVRGSASAKAMSSLDRLPQAQGSSAATRLQTQRIFDSQRELGVAEGLILVHVVEEVIDAAARDGRPARSEAPAERGFDPRRDREEVLRRQVGTAAEAAEQVER